MIFCVNSMYLFLYNNIFKCMILLLNLINAWFFRKIQKIKLNKLWFTTHEYVNHGDNARV